MAVYQSIDVLAEISLSQASQLPQGNAASQLWLCCCSAVAPLLIWLLILISGAPLNHAGRRQVLRSGHPGMDAGVAATRPWMADRGGPTEQCLTAGMPSLGEAPSGGARAFCLLWRFSKVSRRKGGTLSGHDRSNGYVHKPNAGKPARHNHNHRRGGAVGLSYRCFAGSTNRESAGTTVPGPLRYSRE